MLQLIVFPMFDSFSASKPLRLLEAVDAFMLMLYVLCCMFNVTIFDRENAEYRGAFMKWP